jgi:hypothetical protein
MRFPPNPQTPFERACCEEVLRNNLQSGLTPQDLIDEISEVKRQLNDGWRIISGRDLCRIAAICSLRHAGRDLEFEFTLFDYFAKHHAVIDFIGCTTHSELGQWESSNASYTISMSAELPEK